MKKHFKIGVVSGSSREQVNAFLKEIGLKKYFDAIISSSDVKNNKPNPDSYLLGAEKLGVKPKECVGIEDSATGLEALKRAGMGAIVVRHKINKSQDLSKADILVNNLGEITIDMVKNLG